MSNPSKIKSKPYRNWVRGALGLFYLQRGLYPFADRVVKAEHERIVQYLTPCTNCTIENILPVHASGKVCIQKNKARCNCRKKINTSCATCSKIYDDIVLQHRFREPQWVTDCSKWYSDHWQFAKCFLTTTSKGSNNNAAETDASGLLSIIINGFFFQSEIQCNIDPPNDTLSQVREIRNEILHNSTLDLTDLDLTRYLQSMIAVLEDKKALSLDPAAQAATIKLKEILNDELIITTNEEASAIETSLNAIKMAKDQSEESIRKLAEEKQTTIKSYEENIKEMSENSRNALQQQASTSATNIKTVEKEAIEKVTSTVSTVFNETYEPDISKLKLGHDDLENRLRAIEIEQHNLQRKQLELEKQVAKLETQVAKLTIIEEEHKTRIEYLKQEQGLQQYLVEVYQKQHGKTWVAPLMTQQNDVNIRDVYVSPRMVAEDRGTNNKHIKRYRDLFSTKEKRNRKIFILGDVGTGKSSFCKMMMQNWCSAIAKREMSYDSGVFEAEDLKHQEEFNTYDMNRFDFLFFIPLREMSGKDIDDIVDMIKDQFRKYKVLIDDLFAYNSERILIVADGLDEWTSPKVYTPTLQHVTRSLNDSIIVITSRPSSRDILNMKSSEYDLKVTLLGLHYSSVQPMIEKYLKLLHKTSALPDFIRKISNSKVKDIQNAPMLLQQIIWLYCNNYAIDQSRSFIYLNIVNLILGWEQERSGGDVQKLHKSQRSDLDHLALPKSFDKFARCHYNRTLLLLLGKIAYDAYITGSDSSLLFGRYKLNQLGASDDGISAILRTGILTEVNSADPTYEKSRLSFIHTSYLEFFAALYICSCYLSKIRDAHTLATRQNIFDDLIAVTPKTSIAEILRLENVFIMICGIVPCLAEHVCECIYKVSLDESIDYSVAILIKMLIFNCLTEQNYVDQETVVTFKLRHLYDLLDKAWFDMCLYGLDPTSIETCCIGWSTLSHEKCSLLSSFLSRAVSLRTLKISAAKCTIAECEGHIIDLTRHKELQNIILFSSQISISCINNATVESCVISNCELSHQQCSLLSSFLSQAMSTRILKIDRVKCTTDNCEGHIIDLTGHTELQNIELSWNKMSVSGINHACPESLVISNCELSHRQCSLLASFLGQAISIRILKIDRVKCTTDDCEGHIIDLTGHTELQNIELSWNKMSVSGINHACPESCIISNCELTHHQCSMLSDFLSHGFSIQTLKIDKIKCTKDECEGHIIDLKNHSKLQRIEVLGNEISLSSLSHTVLVTCIISDCMFSHEQCTSLSSCLSQAISLKTIDLREFKCTKSECDGHSIDLSSLEYLQVIRISRCNKISISGVNHTCTASCQIEDCKLSPEQCSLLSSFLSQAMKYITLSNIECTDTACEGHVLDLTNHNLLESISISNRNIMSITGINTTCSAFCSVRNCNLTHEQSTSLCTFLSNSIKINGIDLHACKCTKYRCEGHCIDVSNHTNLRHFCISDNTN